MFCPFSVMVIFIPSLRVQVPLSEKPPPCFVQRRLLREDCACPRDYEQYKAHQYFLLHFKTPSWNIKSRYAPIRAHPLFLRIWNWGLENGAASPDSFRASWLIVALGVSYCFRSGTSRLLTTIFFIHFKNFLPCTSTSMVIC